MTNPLTLLTLLGGASSGVQSIVSGVQSALGNSDSANSSDSSDSDFASLLGGAVQSALPTTGNGIIAQTGTTPSPLNSGVGFPLTQAQSDTSEKISDQTLDALNKILNGGNPADISTLGKTGNNNTAANTPANSAKSAQSANANSATNTTDPDAITADSTDTTNTDTTNTGAVSSNNNTNGHRIMDDKKLNDPFGIKAAEANGSPIAAIPGVSPLDPTTIGAQTSSSDDNQPDDLVTALNNAVNSAGAKATAATKGDATANTNGTTITGNAKGNTQTVTADSNDKSLLQDKMASLAKKTDNDAVKNLNDTTQKDLKIADNKADAVNAAVSNAASKTTDTKIDNLQNPQIAAINQIDQKNTNTATVRSADDVKDKLADIDTYKVVNVSKKDNVLDIKLEPEQLGKVQIKLDFTDGKANVVVSADKQQTLDLLQKDTKSIEKILNDNGMKADSGSLSFNLNGQGKGQQQNQDNFNFFSNRPISFRVQEEINKTSNDNTANTLGYANYNAASQNGMLNIIV